MSKMLLPKKPRLETKCPSCGGATTLMADPETVDTFECPVCGYEEPIRWTEAHRLFSAYQVGVMALAREKGTEGLELGCLGLAGETGEVCDLVKKHLYHDTPLDEDKVKKELGDVLWYVTYLCREMGWTLGEVAFANLEKLTARFPSGKFSSEEAQAKADEVPPSSSSSPSPSSSLSLMGIAGTVRLVPSPYRPQRCYHYCHTEDPVAVHERCVLPTHHTAPHVTRVGTPDGNLCFFGSGEHRCIRKYEHKGDHINAWGCKLVDEREDPAQ